MSKDIREIIEEAVLGITQEDLVKKDSGEIPSLRCIARKLKDKQIQNAIARYASSCRKNEMVVLCDTSVMGNGKSGILFSTEGMYCSDLNFLRKKNPIPVPIRYSEIQSVERDDSNIWLNYKDGQKERVYGSIYAAFIVLALQKILSEIRAEKQVETFVESITKRKNPFVEESAEEQFQKAMTAYKNGDFGTAADLYQRAAERGHVNASLCLGLVYDLGEGREKSMEEAFRWYRIAAEKGNSSGMYNTACCYAKGEGTEKDLKKALYWAKQAKDNGDADAAAIIESLEKMMKPEPVVEAKPAPAPEPTPVPEPEPAPLPIQPEKSRMRDRRKDMPSKAKVREYVDIPKPGSVSMWGDSYFVVLSMMRHNEYTDYNTIWIQVRNLSTGHRDALDIVFFSMLVGEEVVVSRYQTCEGGQAMDSSEEKRNVKYPIMDCEIRTCQYIGNYRCKDLQSGMIYELESDRRNKKDLDKATVGDIALVCRFQQNAYFLATYVREEGLCRFSKNRFVKQTSSGEIPLNEVAALYGASGELKKQAEEGEFYSYIGGRRMAGLLYSEGIVTPPAYVLTEVDDSYWLEKRKVQMLYVATTLSGTTFEDTTSDRLYQVKNSFVPLGLSKGDPVLIDYVMDKNSNVLWAEIEPLTEERPATPNNVDSNLKQITRTTLMMYLMYEEGYYSFIDSETADLIEIKSSFVPFSLEDGEVVQVTYTMDMESEEIIQAEVVLVEE